MTTQILQLLSLLLLINNTSQSKITTTTTEKKVNLTYPYLGPTWQKLLKPTDNGTTTTSLFSPNKGDDIFASCKAQFPIQWVVRGVISPTDIVKFQPPKRDLITNTYEIELNIFFLDAAEFSGLGASAVITCVGVNDDPDARGDGFSVFVRGNAPSSLHKHDTSISDNSHIIPCPTTDPTTETHLYYTSTDDTHQTQIQNASYNPTEGFHSKTPFPAGVYVCRKSNDSDSVTVTVMNRVGRVADSYFAPVENMIRQFSDETIRFECGSSNEIKFEFDKNDDVDVVVDYDEKNRKVVRLSMMMKNNGNISSKGKAACIGQDNRVLKESVYEFLAPPTLHIDNHEGELNCLTPSTPKHVQSVRCMNKMECAFMRNSCLKTNNSSTCNFKKQKQFHADTDTRCWVDHLKKGMDCVSLPFSHLNGVVQCGVDGGLLVRDEEFFVSLGFVRYTDWRKAPTSELVRIDEINYNNKTTRYLCTSSSYLFADSLTFEIEYVNGSQENNSSSSKRLVRGTPLQNLPTPDRDHITATHHLIYELNYRAILDVPDDMGGGSGIIVSAVHCLAPFWNSSDVVRATAVRRSESGSTCL